MTTPQTDHPSRPSWLLILLLGFVTMTFGYVAFHTAIKRDTSGLLMRYNDALAMLCSGAGISRPLMNSGVCFLVGLTGFDAGIWWALVSHRTGHGADSQSSPP